jgi:hypothetical protein
MVAGAPAWCHACGMLVLLRYFWLAIGGSLLFAGVPAHAQADVPASPTGCPAGPKGDNCLTAFTADLDGDGEADRISLITVPHTGLYYVVVNTHAGRELWPFAASFNRKEDKVTLTSRSGGGDLRCRHWAERGTCGYPVMTHDVPRTVLYLSDSRRGDFVLYIPQPYGHDYNEDGIFRIVPALDDAPALIR